MNKFRFTLMALAIMAFTLMISSSAQAQATRTWVSGVGDDANPCSRTAPCKTFAGAISKTAACGEIDALDPGGFGAVTITKSIVLDGTGTLASILGSSTNGIIINVANTDFVTIRGISINGTGTSCSFGINGISVVNAGPKSVNIEDCVIAHFTTGVNVNTTSAPAIGTQINIRNTVIRENSGDGVAVNTSAGQIKGSFVNSSFNGNSNGVHAKINARLSADQCNFAGNANNGILADGGTGVANITNSGIFNNGTNGVSAGAGGVIRINNCDIYGNNGSGALVSGGEVDTFANNRILANGTDGCVGCTGKGPA